MSYLDRTDSFIASLGLTAYRAGGSVRDELLGRTPKDADYVICADLHEILTRFYGVKHTVPNATIRALVLRDGRQAGWRMSGKGIGCIEVVLPRTERSTGPGHRDFEIVMDPNLSLDKDAVRRDFTWNALYKIVDGYPTPTVRTNVIDPTGRGIDDLMRRRVSVTHADSFRDDPLRMLRALRFVSTLDYDLSPETAALMLLNAEHVAGLTIKGHVSGTVLDELSKMLMGQNPAKALRAARDTGVLARILPELAPMLGFDQGSRYHDMTTDEHTFVALETAAHVDAPLRVRWALLFHDSGKPDTAWIGKDGRKHYYAPSDETWADLEADRQRGWVEWGGEEVAPMPKPVDHEVRSEQLWHSTATALHTPNALRSDVAVLIRNHMVSCQKVNPTKVRRERVRLGDSILRDLYMMRLCDLSGKGNKNRQFLVNIAMMEAERARSEASGVPAHPRDLEINGRDVRADGAEGREIGRILREVLDEVVCDPCDLKMSYGWQLARAKAKV